MTEKRYSLSEKIVDVRESFGNSRRRRQKTSYEETHNHFCCNGRYRRRVLGHGYGCGTEPLLAIDTSLERGHVGIVPSYRGRAHCVVGCSHTQWASLRRCRGYDRVLP
jgi:hypothetical protein